MHRSLNHVSYLAIGWCAKQPVSLFVFVIRSVNKFMHKRLSTILKMAMSETNTTTRTKARQERKSQIDQRGRGCTLTMITFAFRLRCNQLIDLTRFNKIAI